MYIVYIIPQNTLYIMYTRSKLSVHDNNGNASSSSDSAAHFLLLPQVPRLPHEY